MIDPTGMALRVKLASIVVHVQEMDGTSKTMAFDLPAAKALADDPEVIEWLGTFDAALLPSKRSDD